MNALHMPRVSLRYWLTITMASLFGTNMGDLYAHELKLGIVAGVAVLAALAAVVFVAEKRDAAPRLLYYWLVIVIIRTGATNIADYERHHIRWPELLVCLGLAAIIAVFGALSLKGKSAQGDDTTLPSTGVAYWIAMLMAGIFGTVLGDYCSHAVGQGLASLGLGAVLVLLVAIWQVSGPLRFMLYWVVVAVARTAGTSMGDWVAENDLLNIGLPLSTALTGAAFVLCTLAVAKRQRALAAATA
ncbi:COG4705 family protein [Novosphingobium terrae]|uniref:hypothetical protein n=1 Tax=Novosphingobium terrae TaxID=2726189 RepID=UPI00197F6234|nr:hypothetical protein [Novosphingobium terrae]